MYGMTLSNSWFLLVGCTFVYVFAIFMVASTLGWKEAMKMVFVSFLALSIVMIGLLLVL